MRVSGLTRSATSGEPHKTLIARVSCPMIQTPPKMIRTTSTIPISDSSLLRLKLDQSMAYLARHKGSNTKPDWSVFFAGLALQSLYQRVRMILLGKPIMNDPLFHHLPTGHAAPRRQPQVLSVILQVCQVIQHHQAMTPIAGHRLSPRQRGDHLSALMLDSLGGEEN